MSSFEVTAPDGKLYAVDAPEGATKEQALEHFKANWKPEDPNPVVEYGKDVLGNVSNLYAGIAKGAARPLQMVGEYVAPEATEKVSQYAKNKLTDAGFDPESTPYQIGTLVGETTITAPVGGVLAKGAQALKASPAIVRAIATGGTEMGKFGKGEKLATIGRGIIGGGLTGGASEALLHPEDIATGTAVGAFAPHVLGILGTGATKGYDLLKGKLADVNAGKIARQVLGESLPATREALLNAPQDLTAAQGAYGSATPAFASLEGLASTTRGEPYLEKSRALLANQIRLLKENTPSLTDAEAIRKAAKNISYPIAEAQKTPISPKILGLLERMPSSAVKTAEDLNKYGIGNSDLVKPNFTYETGTKPYISGASTLNIARALKDMIKAPSTENKGANVNIALKGLRDKFLTAMETASPKLGEARKEYAQLSAPVNQSQVMSAYLNKLNPAEGQYNLSGFRTALGEPGQEALLKDILGNKTKGQLAEHLLPTQIGALKNVEGQLIRNEDLAQQAEAGRGTLKKAWDQNTFMQKLPSYLNAATSTTNKALGIAEKKLASAIELKLSKGMESPEDAIKMLDMMPADKRDTIIRALRQSGPTISRAAVLSSTQNKD